MDKVKLPRKKLAIIDGKSVFYRGYYAMPNLTTKDGMPTGGVFGFATMALEVIKRLNPDYVCVAWDKPKTNIRKRLEMYPKYKAGRKPAPPDFYEQIPLLQELLEAFGWPLYELDDYEADDIMGTLAVQASKKDIETLLITSDLDVLQLVDPHVHVYAMKKGFSNIDLYSPASFTAKYGLEATQFLDLKALQGDSSDNIPGVPGVGEKTAIDLLKNYHTLENIYENLALLNAKTAQKLEDGRELAYLSKKLAQIWTDAPIKLNLKEVDGTKCKPEKVRHILERLEFRSLLRQLPLSMQTLTPQKAEEPLIDTSSLRNITIETDEELNRLDVSKSKELIIHSRSLGVHGQQPLFLVLSDETNNYILNLPNLTDEKVRKVLTSIFDNTSILKIGYDIKATIKALLNLDIKLETIHHDVLIGAFLLNSLRREQSLTELAKADLGYEGASLEELDNNEFVERSSLVSTIIRQLYKLQLAKLNKIPKLAKLAQTIEWPVIPVLAKMEHTGVQLDSEYLENFANQLRDSVSDLEQQIYGYADQEFNISSPAQLANILFDKLKLPSKGVKRGKTAYSTAAHELDKLRGIHPIIDLISQYREVTKLMSTYVETLPKMVDENSRLHTTFNLTIAQTGRLSSTDPNLQNIPVRTDLGKHIRTAFVAGPGNSLVSADYSQFELRLAAYLAEDKELVDLFNRDVDVHTATAAKIYEREPEDITKNMRRAAKVVNFGILYGMSPHGLSVATGMTFDAAKHFIDKYFELRQPLLEYLNKLKEKARQDGYVETLFGRRRPMPDIHSSNFAVRMAAERAAMNMPIQGTEADLMKMAMVDIDKKLDDTNCKMLLQIHDSILVECPEADAEKIAKTLKTTMEAVYKLPVKLTVDTSTGQNWGEL